MSTKQMARERNRERMIATYQNLLKLDGNTFMLWVDGNNDHVVELQTRKAVMFKRGASYREVCRGSEARVVKFIKEYAKAQNPKTSVPKPTLPTSELSSAIARAQAAIAVCMKYKSNKGSSGAATQKQLKMFYGNDFYGKVSKGQLKAWCKTVTNAEPQELNSKVIWAVSDALNSPEGYRLVNEVVNKFEDSELPI